MPASQEPMRLKGQVKKETTVIAWSTPGGYCGEDIIANIAANQLTSYIAQTLVPSWDWSNDESQINGLGCFYNPSEYSSEVYCYIEPSSSYRGYSSERLAQKAADALYMQWDREVYKNEVYRGFMDFAFNRAKMQGLTKVFVAVAAAAAHALRSNDELVRGLSLLPRRVRRGPGEAQR